MINEKYLQNFIRCLDEQRFYDAHEVLEELWFVRRFENSNEVKLLKGFINAAVSFELIKRGRLTPSKKAWLNYLKYRQYLFKTKSKKVDLYYKAHLHIENTHKALQKQILSKL